MSRFPNGHTYVRQTKAGLPLSFSFEFGIPHANWLEFASLLSLDPQERNTQFTEGEWLWLQEVALALGGRYRVYADGLIWVMTDLGDAVCSTISRAAAGFLRSISRSLAGIISPSQFGADTLLIYSDVKLYYSHIAHFYSDGDYAGSGGMCLRQGGQIHVAMPYTEWAWRSVLAHELAHVVLSEFSLPLWLEEGIVHTLESQICPSVQTEEFLLPQQLLETKRFWNGRVLDGFWTGETFSDFAAQEHSYRLAAVIARQLMSQDRIRFARFVMEATESDHGSAASQKYLAKSLTDLACVFLGKR